MLCDRCIDMQCEKISAKLPWNEEYWVCPSCQSTFPVEKKQEKLIKRYREEINGTQEEI